MYEVVRVHAAIGDGNKSSVDYSWVAWKGGRGSSGVAAQAWDMGSFGWAEMARGAAKGGRRWWGGWRARWWIGYANEINEGKGNMNEEEWLC
jgi:hypothetical protein